MKKETSLQIGVGYDAGAVSTSAQSTHHGNGAQDGKIDDARMGLFCPNCNGPLEGRKCKLFCLKPGCGYLVTCSEW